MVTFSTYVQLAYEVLEEKGVRVDNPEEFMSDLADVYKEQGHRDASKSAAKSYLRRVVK